MVKTELILLLNVVAMFILSVCTDYWVYRSYDFKGLMQVLRNYSQVRVEGWSGGFSWQSYVQIRMLCGDGQENCTEETEFLFTEYGNLYRECNDLLAGYRERLKELGKLYDTGCIHYLRNDSWHQFRTQSSTIPLVEQVSLSFACASAVALILSVGLGVFSTMSRELHFLFASGVSLLSSGFLYVVAIILFCVKIELIQSKIHEKASNRSIREEQRWIAGHHTTSFGWSFAAAILCLLLDAVAAYLFFAGAREIREHRKHLQRRRQLQMALMSSCRQDVALAIRAKMTLKTNV